MHIKMDDYLIEDKYILKDSYSVALENTYAQAKRTNTLAMVKILLGAVYTVTATLKDITSDELRRIQEIAKKPEIMVEFYDDQYKKNYVVQNMYCPTIKPVASRQLANGKILYKDFTIEFIGNYAAD